MLATLLKAFGFDGDDPRIRQDYEIKEEKASTGLILPKLNRRMFMAGAVATAAVATLPAIPEFPRRAYSFPTQIRKRIPGIKIRDFMMRRELMDVTPAYSQLREVMPSGRGRIEFSTYDGLGVADSLGFNDHYGFLGYHEIQVVLSDKHVAHYRGVMTGYKMSLPGNLCQFEMEVIEPIAMTERPLPDRATLQLDDGLVRYSNRLS